jgi:prepilin-type N-terminal cleavage/methylation domain-containing protein/prepilin-type processing-associated H-X9-DG protein
MRMRRRKGFTLIELLVVIAIISILASMIFPVYSRARENARRASCMSNMRQFGIAIQMYTQDYDAKYPGSYKGVLDTTSMVKWSEILQPHIKSRQIFRCPTEVATVDDPYAYNGIFINNEPQGLGAADYAVSESAVPDPTRTIMVVDGEKFFVPPPIPATAAVDDNLNIVSKRHLEGANVLWADGHVKWNRKDYLTANLWLYTIAEDNPPS